MPSGRPVTTRVTRLVEVRAENRATLDRILAQIADHGAVPTATQDCRLMPADIEGAFPEGFYSTTNQRTEIRLAGEWVPVMDQEMDCGIRVDGHTARCVPMNEVQRGEAIVVGHAGVRVFPEERSRGPQAFAFMDSNVSTEKPKGLAIREVARELVHQRAAGGKTLLVGGPAIIHTGSGEFLQRLIRMGYIDVLFAGNALATHDIEQALFGTSLGVYLDREGLAEAGHEHHLRAINRIRRAGGIRQAVEAGILTSGIMYECVRHGVDFLLAGSIRDDGPLPEVITDVAGRPTTDAREDPRRDLLPDGRHDAALDRGGKPPARVDQSRLRRHQSLDGHQALRPGLVPDHGAGDRRGAVSAGAGGRTCGPGIRERDDGRAEHDIRCSRSHVPARLLCHPVRNQSVDEPQPSHAITGWQCGNGRTCAACWNNWA